MSRNTKKVALYGMLTALALVLSYVEAQFPAFFAIPGMKLGLTNVLVLLALYNMGYPSAVVINILRIIIVAFMFGNGISWSFSIAGGLLSGLVMMLLKKTGKFSIAAVSIAGGIAHNIGQILVAMFVLETTSLAWYLLILWFSGIAAGLAIGILGGILVKRTGRMFQGVMNS